MGIEGGNEQDLPIDNLDDKSRLLNKFHQLFEQHILGIGQNGDFTQVRGTDKGDPYFRIQWLATRPNSDKDVLVDEEGRLENRRLILELLEKGLTPLDFAGRARQNTQEQDFIAPAKMFSRMLMYIMKDLYYTPRGQSIRNPELKTDEDNDKDSEGYRSTDQFVESASYHLELAAEFDFELALAVSPQGRELTKRELVVVGHSLGHSGSHLLQLAGVVSRNEKYSGRVSYYYEQGIIRHFGQISMAQKGNDYADEFNARYGLRSDLVTLQTICSRNKSRLDRDFLIDLDEALRQQQQDILDIHNDKDKRVAIIRKVNPAKYNKMISNLSKSNPDQANLDIPE